MADFMSPEEQRARETEIAAPRRQAAAPRPAQVRVVRADSECAAMSARAFTTGDGAGGHVVALAGDVDLNTSDGQFTLLHELAHVEQQRAGEAEALDGLGGDPSQREALERAADATAQAGLDARR